MAAVRVAVCVSVCMYVCLDVEFFSFTIISVKTHRSELFLGKMFISLSTLDLLILVLIDLRVLEIFENLHLLSSKKLISRVLSH